MFVFARLLNCLFVCSFAFVCVVAWLLLVNTVCLYACMLVCLFLFALFACFLAHLNACPFVCWFVCLLACLFACLRLFVFAGAGFYFLSPVCLFGCFFYWFFVII